MKHSREQGHDVTERGARFWSAPLRDPSAPQGARHRRAATPPAGADTPADTEGTAPSYGDSGPLVRPYTMTGGRTRSRGDTLDMITIVVAARQSEDGSAPEPEHADILRLCRTPISVAELSAQLDIPMTVVKVLLGDLITNDEVRAREPMPTADLPEMNILQAVLDGIRRL